MVGLLFEYLNMVFWLDANALFFGSRQLRARRSELLRVLSAVGEVDAAIGVASYRADSTGWTRPILRTGTAVLTEVRHPLLPDAVPNTIRLAPPHGVTITGSNMSGKINIPADSRRVSDSRANDQHVSGSPIRGTGVRRAQLHRASGRSGEREKLLPG